MTATKAHEARLPITVTCSRCGRADEVLDGSAWATSGLCTPCFAHAHPGADSRYRAILPEGV